MEAMAISMTDNALRSRGGGLFAKAGETRPGVSFEQGARSDLIPGQGEQVGLGLVLAVVRSKRDFRVHVVKSTRFLRLLTYPRWKFGSGLISSRHGLNDVPSFSQAHKNQRIQIDLPRPLLRRRGKTTAPEISVLSDEFPHHLFIMSKKIWIAQGQSRKPIWWIYIPKRFSLTHNTRQPIRPLFQWKSTKSVLDSPLNEARKCSALLSCSQFCQVAQFWI